MKNLSKFLVKYEKYLISTHESPDCDGLGAEIGFHELLKNLGQHSLIVNSDPVPEKLGFLDIDREINVYSRGYPLPDDIDQYALFILDTNTASNIGSLYAALKDSVRDIFIIDHHEGPRNIFDDNFIKVEASSCSEIIYDLTKFYGFEPSFKAAQALYSGILFDTGSFRYPKTSPDTFRCIARLVELGANPFKIYEYIYENNSLSSFELRALMLASMEIHYDGRLILMKLNPEMLKKTGASYQEGEFNINLPHTVKGVVASILIKQDIDGPIKVSLRTKGDYDVAKIAMAKGGGGHKNAAGYKSTLSFDEACREAIRDVAPFFTSQKGE